MSQHTINITGITTGIGPQSGPPPRRSIFDVVGDPKAFSLLVQGLGMLVTRFLAMQRTPHSAPQLRCNKWTRVRRLLISNSAESTESRTSSGTVREDVNRYPAIGKAIVLTALFCSRSGIVLMSFYTRCETLNRSRFDIADNYSAFPTYSKSFKHTWSASLTSTQLLIRLSGKMQQPTSVYATGTGLRIRCLRLRSSLKRLLTSSWRTAQRKQSRIRSFVILSIPSQTVTSIPLGANGTPLYDALLMIRRTHRATPSNLLGDFIAKLSCVVQLHSFRRFRNLTGRNGSIAYQLKQATYIMLTQNSQWLNMSNHSRG